MQACLLIEVYLFGSIPHHVHVDMSVKKPCFLIVSGFVAFFLINFPGSVSVGLFLI